jgi:CSLREA domain-containing protein
MVLILALLLNSLGWTGFASPQATAQTAPSRIGDVSDTNVTAATPTVLVTSKADTDDHTCNATNCTLREAINAANSLAGNDVIGFASGIEGVITLATALPAISTNVQISGPGADKLTVQRSGATGTPNFSVLRITAGTVAVSGLTISGGATATDGGGISNSGTLTLNGCTVTSNKSTERGAGIYNAAQLTINDGTISDNSVSGTLGGGGIFNDRLATVTISKSVISGNTGRAGGGIYNSGTVTISEGTISANQDLGISGAGVYNNGSLTVTNSTVSGNGSSTSSGDGAGIYNNNTCVVISSTISGNTTRSGWGGGIYNQSSLTLSGSTITNNSANVAGGTFNSGTINIVNTLIAGNRAGSELPDVHGAYVSRGYNLIGNRGTFSSGFGAVGDKVGTPATPLDPKLGPLALNGGTTKTHALLAGSPAIDQGKCSEATPTDQRGVFRYDFSDLANADGGCDMGAFEAQALPLVSANAVNATEGDLGTSDLTFSVSLDHPAITPVAPTI